MTLEGGPCTVMRKRRGQSAVGVCGDAISGAWYAGPTCKACYERGVRAKNRAKKQKQNQTEEDEVDMTGVRGEARGEEEGLSVSSAQLCCSGGRGVGRCRRGGAASARNGSNASVTRQ